MGRTIALNVSGEGAEVAVVAVDETGGHEAVRAVRAVGGTAEFQLVDVGSSV